MKRAWLFAAVLAAAAARLLLQNAALPPYAGLDEVYHVARLVFVLQEGRDPDIREDSIAPYLLASTLNAPGAIPTFGLIAARWPELLRERGGRVLLDREPDRGYGGPNYEAQQAPLYYRVAAPLAHLLPHRTQLRELQLWRLLSVFFALLTVLATALLGEHFYGARGVLAAVLLPLLPTWLTLVVRAGNDSLACALLAFALLVTIRGGPVALEALLWAAALATKLYTWPVLVIVIFFWPRSRKRLLICGAACLVSLALTIAFLASHTRNPVGVFGFDAPVARAAARQPIAYAEMIKTTLASAVWTSGQHGDALRIGGMLLYALPLIAVLLVGITRAKQKRLVIAALIAFGAAQLVNAAAFIRQAQAAGLALPLGGKEGWYWYVLAPLIVALVFPKTPLRFLAVWLLGWDVLIHECALFHDFAGTSTPAQPSFLFRWGPLHAPFTARLAGIAVGPLAGALVALRLVQAGAMAAAFVLESSDDRDTHAGS
ncbi:MAG TPA: hypothetical protein VJ276_12215 [Thermoanaerobaculia bacterium]|nr:hypothetical protein [Thermoanaerobaculia bacterium]